MNNFLYVLNKLEDSVCLLLNNQVNVHQKNEILCLIQDMMIKYGTSLEKQIGENNEIITLFEECCEICYQYSANIIDKRKFENSMIAGLDKLESAYFGILPGEADRVSVVAIMRNEEYVLEWIEYHRIIGVTHFYIYDNESTNNLKEKLQPYIEEGIVTYTYYPGDVVQLKAYVDAIERYKYNTEWMAFIDADEYIVPVEDVLLPDLLDEIKCDWEQREIRDKGNVGGIGINWRSYGTSGHKKKAEGMCIENYNYRAKEGCMQDVHIKTICNPRVVEMVYSPHTVQYRKGFYNISENGSAILSTFFMDGRCERIRINHYFSKSEEEYISKLERGWPDQEHISFALEEIRKKVEMAANEYNQVYDPIMKRYLERVRNRLDLVNKNSEYE